MALTDEQRRRYARNISLDGIGEGGQEKLLASHVLVVGAGGLGSAVISYLAAAGLGHISIVDHDRVELSNLQRQILHETGDIGRLKVESARDRVEEINPDVKITIHPYKLDSANAGKLIANCDIVADGSDNFATRFAVSDACHAEKKPLVTSAIRAYEGQLAVFKSYLGAPHACYHCFISSSPDDERGCSDVGVLGSLAGAMGSLQALQVIKELLQIGELFVDKLFFLDGRTMMTRVTKIMRDPQCKFCSAAMKNIAQA